MSWGKSVFKASGTDPANCFEAAYTSEENRGPYYAGEVSFSSSQDGGQAGDYSSGPGCDTVSVYEPLGGRAEGNPFCYKYYSLIGPYGSAAGVNGGRSGWGADNCVPYGAFHPNTRFKVGVSVAKMASLTTV